MQNLKFKSFTFLLFVLPFYLFLLTFFGCATAPQREALPTCNINGVAYLPLTILCDSRGINWEYDTFSRTIILSKDGHKINLHIGDTLVLVDGRAVSLRYPIDISNGAVVVPFRFKEDVLDPLFKESYPFVKETLPLSKIKRVVIDAGHGGSDPGTIGRRGLREKDVNLDIIKRLANFLRADGLEVVITRSSDKFISLEKRVDIANRSKADLFISIHSNANRVRSLNGFEVYYVSPSVNDSQRALTAAKNALLNLDDKCFDNSSLNLKAILWDMIYTYERAESIELARSICRKVDMNLDAKILGIKDARFYVLKGVRMPAVLIEVGFLSNYKEESLLKNGFYRQQLADSICQGIEDYIRDFTLAQAQK